MKIKNCEKPILLVEDNPIDVDLTIRAFKKNNLGNEIKVARDGEEALNWIQKWDEGEPTPIVILLDLNLPRYNGLEVLKELKSHELYKTIPVIILTTSAESKDIETAYKLGANSYIVKPVELDKFIEVAAQIDLYWRVYNELSS
ncbi:MAG: two-component system response regulator [Bacteroidetes bacterium HGW-Bacteroidetes-17]|jgi:CheY-like chemotaxis protein|nr:MAG: two-component system response regulator [Bacteroidetes bacterium HGW-Bacteroidetes-17]